MHARHHVPTALLVITLFAVPGCGYNDLQGLDEDIKAAWSEVLNQYQRRADLIPNLVETVKGYAAHEKETLTAVTQARAQVAGIKATPELLKDPDAFQKFQAAQGELSSALARLMVVVEKYPNLKANENFRDLQSQLEGTENRISVARRDYILAVQEYNTALRTIPQRWIASILYPDMKVRETFTIPEQSQQVPQVKF